MTLEAANEAAKDFGGAYGFEGDKDSYAVYEEGMTQDGRFSKHIEDEQYTLDAQVETRTLVGSMDTGNTDANAPTEPRHAGGKQEDKALPAKREQHFVYIVTHEEYDQRTGDCGSVDIVGVYGSVTKANKAASKKATDDYDMPGSDEDSERQECYDNMGCITISQVDDGFESWSCTVKRHAVK